MASGPPMTPRSIASVCALILIGFFLMVSHQINIMSFTILELRKQIATVSERWGERENWGF